MFIPVNQEIGFVVINVGEYRCPRNGLGQV